MMIQRKLRAGGAGALLAALGLCAATYTWADQADVVKVPSLAVKERLHALEQINVTAEKTPVDVEVESARVQDILDEAARLDEQAELPQRESH